ncbi:MAG TPA: ADOP family duplicated permease [Thermoanaerobaculia bacterium]|jgi:predicted permease|nr:ADOP family duplicated permease [Thermoanaerobaculia bacterium]
MDWLRLVARTARRLAHEPGFTLGALLLLALGIGLSTAAFGVLDRLLWQPVPGVSGGDRVVTIYSRQGGTHLSVATYADLVDLGDRGRAFERVAAFKPLDMEVETAAGGEPQADSTTGMLVSADYFRVLGLSPAAGRFFVREENASPGAPVVVLGHDLWQRRFGGRADVVGRTVAIEGMRFTVVGVAPPGFGGTSEDMRASLFLPMALQPTFMGEDLLPKRSWGGVLGIARLRPQATVAQAAADLQRVSAELARDYPSTNAERTMHLEPLAASHLSALSRSLWQGASAMLAATVALVLLVACTNVATLLTARAVARREELGLRRTLGATPQRLASELGLETLLLALGGGLGGVFVAQGALALARRSPLRPLQEVILDRRALLVALAATLLSALLAALAPLRESRRQLEAPLRSAGATRWRGRAVGVALQLGVSLVLLVGTTLFARTLGNLLNVPLGFETRGLLVGTVSARALASSNERAARWQSIAEALREVPGVRAAALTSRLPGGGDYDEIGVRIAGENVETLGVQAVGGDYFRTLGIASRQGRTLEIADERGAAPVAVVNDSLARRYWPGQSALGHTIEVIDHGTITIVGVVPDTKDGELRGTAAPLFYVPWSLGAVETAPRSFYFVARTSGEPRALTGSLREAAIAAGAGRAPRIRPFDDFLAAITARERTAVALLGALSALSLLLTTIGLYSLLAWSVARRTRELGVRAALGAGRGSLERLVLAQALRLAAVGIVAGGAVGMALAGASRKVLFGVGPYDPWNLALPAALLLAAALAAAWWPARRATRIDPMTALRG